MLRFKSIALVLVFTVLAMSVVPTQAEAKKPWWKIVGGLLATGGAVAAGLTGAGAGVVVPLCGVETALLGTAAGGGSNNGGGIAGGISDSPPSYCGPILPDFCGGTPDCQAQSAILKARLMPLPLPGTTPTLDNLTRAVNALMANPLKDHMFDGSDLPTVQGDMRAMAAQLDSVVFWLDEAEAEDPGNRVMITPQMLAQARDWMAVNGLPEEEVEIYRNAGLTDQEIDAIAAFHVDAMADIELIGPPISMQDVLREAADSFRAMGTAVAAVGGRAPVSLFSVKQNTPNPFNPSTVIAYEMNREGPLSIKVFNARGELVKTLADGFAPAGSGTVSWHGQDERGAKVPSGVYFYQIQSGGEVSTKKMTLLK